MVDERLVDERLLDSKLTPPVLRPGLVSRVALIETARSSDCRVVGVTAPAGYGKSTLLAQWAGCEDRRVAWVSLDRFDDDPAALLALLATAYARILRDGTDCLLMSDSAYPCWVGPRHALLRPSRRARCHS